MPPKRVLITGGTGLIGSRLTELLLEKNYEVRYLSRSPGKVNNVEAFEWDVKKQTMDTSAIAGVTGIINLAGAGVADKRWNQDRKKLIMASRTRSTALLKDTLRDIPNQVKVVVSASGINYYGYDTGGVVKKEASRFGDDFLATVTKAWEAEADLIADLDIRVVKMRIGMVLSRDGGALDKMKMPIKYGLGAPLGSGDQYVSWVHIDDLCRMFIYAIENENISGAYNAVTPYPVTNKQLTKEIGKALGKPVFLPKVPAFALKLALGEMASMVLGGVRASPEKIMTEGFEFKYPGLKEALSDLFA
ncbi:Cell division inhibitor [Fulvivirga imtechensis AK7]|uniref:Cell division inhibitor n=1 Tax=Fulvivirga imtechensis AK7 TaxID=1237149 RepID=L8JL45_9BACT|nr:TIGR01777 family oxidoreductase [Fulvivirga imtechensis]ELR69530.1 Cell division inhibitor [Fulvivirga imtechensis AK7]